jgi:aldehyde reductase
LQISRLQTTDSEGENVVKYAIDLGYRHFDTAYFYCNESEVGKAVLAKISEGAVTREDFFITTKLWNIHHGPEHVLKACQKSLENLKLDYIDLYLMHTPMGYEFRSFEGPLLPYDDNNKLVFSDVDYVDTWKAMEGLVKAGLVKSIGVSNFNSEQLQRVLDMCEIKPVVNQVECSPRLNQKRLIRFCKSKDIVLTAYSPMGRPHYYAKDPTLPKPVLFEPEVQQIGDKYNKTPGQVVLRYLVQTEAYPLPKSANQERLAHNLDIFDFELTNEELRIMDAFHTGERTVPFALCTEHKYFPFKTEF